MAVKIFRAADYTLFSKFHFVSSDMWAATYRIAGKFGGDNVWRIDSYKLFGEEKFGEWLSTKKIFRGASLRFLCATIQ